MRLFLAALCAVSPAGLGSHAAQLSGACNRPLPTAPPGLPTRVLVTTQCGTYGIDHDGSVVVANPVPSAPAPWRIGLRQGHLVLIENERIVWRSRRRFAAQFDGAQSIAVGRRALAFSFDDRRLWFSRFDGTEHVVARGEAAIAWTAGDKLLTDKWRARPLSLGTLFVRDSRGRHRSHLASKLAGLAFDDATKMLFFTTASGELDRTDGKTVAQIADLSGDGFTWFQLWPQLIGDGLIAFQGDDRIVVLRSDGSTFGSSSFGGGTWTSLPVASARGVAFTVADADGLHESVYLLRAGDRSARPLYRTPSYVDGCRGAALSWRGDWLLYWTTEGRVAGLDASEAHGPIDLTDTVAKLPGVDRDPDSGMLSGFSAASWA